MKQVFAFLSAILLTASVFAQSPNKMSYQAVIRNSSDALVTSTTIGMQISILQGSMSGTAVYVETQTPTTNANGLVSIEIGGGSVVLGVFAAIDWANGPYFIKTETDPAGGTSYTITGTSQLLSVPYALHAKTAGSFTGTITETDPVFTLHPASGISATNITNWDNAFAWGDHAGLYRPISWVPSWTDVTGKPTFATVAVSGSYNDLTDKNTAGNGIHIDGTNQISLSITNQSTGDMMYFDGTNWVKVAAGTTGQILAVNASGVPEWQNPSSLKSAGTNTPTMDATGVIFNGVVNPNGLSTMVAFEYGTDITYGNSATVSGSPFSGTTNTTVSSALISGLTAGTTYHVRIVTQNIFGAFYGNDFTFTYLYYGASYAGGIVFSFDSNGEHGFVCAPDDQSTCAEYFQYYFQDNVGHFSGPDLFYSCEGTINEYNDWYAPSLTLLNMMYTNLKANGLGSFANDYYWSTNIQDPSIAYRKDFTNGIINTGGREFNSARVRAVRHF